MSTAPDALFSSFQEALAGRYFLERELGRGGMGIVYLAREVRLDRPVAIKLLPPHLAAHEPLRERFLREARTAARLSQPNIVPIFSVDEVGPFVFYAMAYVEGETLAQRVARGGPLRPGQAARVLREVAWALAYAHARGVVHRDVKPENILLEQGTGRALVTDFGIARLAAAGGTEVGEVLGTPEFMSPEQAAGEPVDGRSDLYSLGIVGYYMLSGRVPFVGVNASAVLSQHLTRLPAPVATVAMGFPQAMTAAIDRCLAKDPGLRFPHGEALAEALSDALGTTADTPPPVRVFLKFGAGAGAGALLWYLTVGYLSYENWIRSSGASLIGQLLNGLVVLAVNGAPPALLLYQARRLLRHGYGPDDVVLALRREAERRAEEAAVVAGPPASLPRRVLNGLGFGLLAAGTVLVVFTLVPLPNAEFVAFLCGGFLLGLVGGLIGVGRPAKPRGSRLWGGAIGRWIFRIAGLGLRGRPPAPAGSRPTELAIGDAAVALFEALDRETRRTLSDLPEVVRRLERHARQIRERIAEIARTIADAGSALSTVRTVQHRALVADLEAARDAAHARLGQVAAALETIRVGLLRLRAGAGSIEKVTADLTAARAVGDQTERLLQAGEEVDATLRSS